MKFYKFLIMSMLCLQTIATAGYVPPVQDWTYFWTFHYSCSTCMDYLGLPEHDPTYKRKDLPDYVPHYILSNGVWIVDEAYANSLIGHGFSPREHPVSKDSNPELDYLLFGVWTGTESTIYWRCDDFSDFEPYMYGFTNRNYIAIGSSSGGFPKLQFTTIKAMFGSTEKFPEILLKHMTNGIPPVFKFDDFMVGYRKGIIYWVEAHIKDTVYRVDYFPQPYEHHTIPSEYTNAPDGYIVYFHPQTRDLGFIARPDIPYQYGHWSTYILERATDLTEADWIFVDQITAYHDDCYITTKIKTDTPTGFFRVRRVE